MKILIEKLMKKNYESIVDFIDKVALKKPFNTAVQYEDVLLNYKDLVSKSCTISNLIKKNIDINSVVVIFLNKSIEMVTTTVGVLRAGCTYLPIDTRIPSKRLEYILADSNAKCILTSRKYITKLHLQNKKCIFIEDINWNVEYPYHKASTTLNQLAYIIYTSGSTGLPKGVMIKHSSLINLAIAQSKIFGITSNSKILQFASWGFDASVSEWSTTFVKGATLCIMPNKPSGTQQSIAKHIELYMKKYVIDILTLPPSVIATIDFPYLPKTLVTAGETCTQNIINKYCSLTNFYNAYGPTEGTVCSTIMKCTMKHPPATIGKPLDNVKVYILDKELRQLLCDKIGEICIAGDGLSLGYINQIQLTEEKFIKNPFNTTESLYRTGDLGRYLEDGNIEFIGRNDNQIKLKGCRIELGEVEQIIEQHTSVRQAVVFKKIEPTTEEQILVAYLILINNTENNIIFIQNYISEYLPKYMIPTNYIVLDEFPLTTNGKINREQLLTKESISLGV